MNIDQKPGSGDGKKISRTFRKGIYSFQAPHSTIELTCTGIDVKNDYFWERKRCLLKNVENQRHFVVNVPYTLDKQGRWELVEELKNDEKKARRGELEAKERHVLIEEECTLDNHRTNTTRRTVRSLRDKQKMTQSPKIQYTRKGKQIKTNVPKEKKSCVGEALGDLSTDFDDVYNPSEIYKVRYLPNLKQSRKSRLHTDRAFSTCQNRRFKKVNARKEFQHNFRNEMKEMKISVY